MFKDLERQEYWQEKLSEFNQQKDWKGTVVQKLDCFDLTKDHQETILWKPDMTLEEMVAIRKKNLGW